MKKINFNNLKSLGIEKLSKQTLKNLTGGTAETCDNSMCMEDEICQSGPFNTTRCVKVGEASVSGLCKFNIIYSSGEPQMFLKEFGLQPNGQVVSNLANSECLLYLSTPNVTKCKYDCGWDGWGN